MVNEYNIIRQTSARINNTIRTNNIEASIYRDMQRVYRENSNKRCVFIYVRNDKIDGQFIDIYFYRDIAWPMTYKQFRIIPDYRFKQQDEEEFLYLIHRKNLHIEYEMFCDVQITISELFPQWHMNKTKSIGQYLDNLYFVSHRSGPKEIMYKSGLQNIAYGMDQIEDYNLIGSSPQEILEMPLPLCRIINEFGDVKRISDEISRKHMISVYEKYSSLISKTITKDQWKYLEQDCWGRKFNRKLFNYIKEINADIYKRYIEIDSLLGDLNPYKKLPSPKDIYEKLQFIESIANHMEDKEFLDKGIQKHRIADLAYENSDYEAIVPSTMVQIIKEAINMHNCLMTYLYNLSNGGTHIVFIRKKCDTEESYMDIEIAHRKIITARLKFNALPKVEDMEFLIEYAREKDLICRPRELIMEDGEYDELFGREDLIDFLEGIEKEDTNADARLDGGDFYFDGQRWDL